MQGFFVLTVVGLLTVVTAARLLRNGQFALFVGVILGIYSLSAVAIAPAFRGVLPVFAAFHATVYINFLALSRPRMRPLAYRILVSWPAAFFAAGTLLAMPWAALMAVGFYPWAPWLPYALAAAGMLQSLTGKSEVVDIVVRGPTGPRTERLAPHPRGDERDPRPLRIVQITDPHLGPFMSVARLARIAREAVHL